MLPTALVDPDSKCHSQRQSTYQLVYRHYTYFWSFFESFITCNFYERENVLFHPYKPIGSSNRITEFFR